MQNQTEISGLRPPDEDVFLADEERIIILESLYRLAMVARPSNTPEVWLRIARKLEGVDKQVIVRTARGG